MRQKILKYVLIGGVAIIWGLIIYKLIEATGEDTMPIKSVASRPVISAESEKFSLRMDYPDPFLPDTASIPDTVAVASISPSAPTITTEAPKPDLSFIQYHGMISNPSKKTKIAMVSLNGKELLVHEKEEIGEIIFRNFTKEELIISWNNKRYVIRK